MPDRTRSFAGSRSSRWVPPVARSYPTTMRPCWWNEPQRSLFAARRPQRWLRL